MFLLIHAGYFLTVHGQNGPPSDHNEMKAIAMRYYSNPLVLLNISREVRNPYLCNYVLKNENLTENFLIKLITLVDKNGVDIFVGILCTVKWNETNREFQLVSAQHLGSGMGRCIAFLDGVYLFGKVKIGFKWRCYRLFASLVGGNFGKICQFGWWQLW